MGLRASGLGGPTGGGGGLADPPPSPSPGFSVFAPESRNPQPACIQSDASPSPVQQVLGQEDPDSAGGGGWRGEEWEQRRESPGQGQNQSWRHLPLAPTVALRSDSVPRSSPPPLWAPSSRGAHGHDSVLLPLRVAIRRTSFSQAPPLPRLSPPEPPQGLERGH